MDTTRMENKRATFLVAGIAFGAVLAGAAAAIAGVCEGAPGVTRALGTGFDSFAQGLEPYRSLFLFGTLPLSLGQLCLTYLSVAALYAGVPMAIETYVWGGGGGGPSDEITIGLT